MRPYLVIALISIGLACNSDKPHSGSAPHPGVRQPTAANAPSLGRAPGSTYPHPLLIIPPRSMRDEPLRTPATPAVRIAGEPPTYTEVGRMAGVAGIVVLEIVIERNGAVSDVHVLKPLPFGLDQAAVRAVQTWRYRPARDHGRAVRSVQQVRVPFAL